MYVCVFVRVSSDSCKMAWNAVRKHWKCGTYKSEGEKKWKDREKEYID